MSKIKDNVLPYIIPILIASIVVLIVVLVGITIPGIRDLLRHEYASAEFFKATEAGPLKYLAPLVVSIGVLIALLTYLREKEKQKKEIDDRESRFFFEQAKAGLEDVYDLLKDQNNDRVIWIRAARYLLHSLNLSRKITSPEYKEAYRLAEEKIRHNLSSALENYNEKTEGQDALPPQFFYGLKDWRQVQRPLDEAAKLTRPRTRAQPWSIDTVFRLPSFSRLSRRSIVAIYDFLEYPNEYVDPLESLTIWDSPPDRIRVGGIDEGARKYVYHRLHADNEAQRTTNTPNDHTKETTR